jgi:hypothetical protein
VHLNKFSKIHVLSRNYPSVTQQGTPSLHFRREIGHSSINQFPTFNLIRRNPNISSFYSAEEQHHEAFISWMQNALERTSIGHLRKDKQFMIEALTHCSRGKSIMFSCQFQFSFPCSLISLPLS